MEYRPQRRGNDTRRRAARETMLKFVGVSLALLESKEGVLPAAGSTSTVSNERSMAVVCRL